MKIENDGKYVVYKCDNCGKEIKLLKHNYNKKRKCGDNHNKDFCSSCVSAITKSKWFENVNEDKKEAWINAVSKGSKNRKVTKVNCEKCGKEISSNQYNRHLKSCDGNPIPKRERGEKLNGKSIWNKGLTKETDERVRINSEKTNKTLREKYKRGEFIPFGNGKNKENTGWSWGKGGYYTTWNNKTFYYRSGYELDYMHILDKNKIDYEVENLRIKYFNSLKNEYRFAKPDIFIASENLIVEIK